MNKMNISFASVALLYTARFSAAAAAAEQRGIERRGSVQRGIVTTRLIPILRSFNNYSCSRPNVQHCVNFTW